MRVVVERSNGGGLLTTRIPPSLYLREKLQKFEDTRLGYLEGQLMDSLKAVVEVNMVAKAGCGDGGVCCLFFGHSTICRFFSSCAHVVGSR